MIDTVAFIYSAACGAIVVLIWLIRLESKVLYLEKDHDKLAETSAKTDMIFQSKIDKLGNDIGDIKVSLARIESTLSKRMTE